MADEKKVETPEIPAVPSRPLTRNELVKDLTPMRIVKGTREGQPYLAPQWNPKNDVLAEIAWWGLAYIESVVNRDAKKGAQDIWFDESQIDEAGQFLIDKVIQEMAEFDKGGLKLSEIQDRLEEVQAIMSQILRSGKLFDDSDPVSRDEARKKMKEYDNYYLSLKAQKEKRSKKKTETAAEPSIAVQ